MMTDYKARLQQAVAEAFENMAFQEVVPVPLNPLPAPVLWTFRQGSMTIYLPLQGTLVMTISSDMLRLVTANVYGNDPEDIDDSMESDTLAETLNTIAGSWMRSITEEGLSYELGLPDINETDYIDCKVAEIYCVFNSEDDFIEVAFFPA